MESVFYSFTFSLARKVLIYFVVHTTPHALLFFKGKFMAKLKKNDLDIKTKKKEVNLKHIEFYDKSLDVLNFILDEFSRELTRADIEFLEMPKNSIATLDFLISSIVKVQKGQRIALGLDIEDFEDTSPQINIIEGLNEEKI